MNAKQKIIMFMTHKDRMVAHHLGEGGIRYFTEEDEKDIQKWTDLTCEYVWSEIRKYIVLLGRKGLITSLCPYCLVNLVNWPECNECQYMERHGNCSEESSDFHKIVAKLSRTRVEEIFSNDYYVQLIIDLSREDEDDSKREVNTFHGGKE